MTNSKRNLAHLIPARTRQNIPKTLSRIQIAEQALSKPEDAIMPWDVLCATAADTAQSRGVTAQKLVGECLGAETVCASKNCGDLLVDGRHTEVKSSFTPGEVNIRQVRPWQDADYIVVHAPVENGREKARCYRLTHDQMMEEVEMLGCYSHGTREVGDTNTHAEYSITLRRNGHNPAEVRWEGYRDASLEKALFGQD